MIRTLLLAGVVFVGTVSSACGSVIASSLSELALLLSQVDVGSNMGPVEPVSTLRSSGPDGSVGETGYLYAGNWGASQVAMMCALARKIQLPLTCGDTPVELTCSAPAPPILELLRPPISSV